MSQEANSRRFACAKSKIAHVPARSQMRMEAVSSLRLCFKETGFSGRMGMEQRHIYNILPPCSASRRSPTASSMILSPLIDTIMPPIKTRVIAAFSITQPHTSKDSDECSRIDDLNLKYLNEIFKTSNLSAVTAKTCLVELRQIESDWIPGYNGHEHDRR